jgi:hypothetical protein
MAYKESRFNRLDAPVPGESLTATPRNAKWEHPPQMPETGDAFEFIWDQMHKEPQLTQLISLLDTGVPVEALAKTLLFAGFGEGKWTVDGAILLAEPVFLSIAALAKNAGLKEVNLSMEKKDPISFARESQMMKEMSKEVTDVKKELTKVKKVEEQKGGLMAKPMNVKEI